MANDHLKPVGTSLRPSQHSPSGSGGLRQASQTSRQQSIKATTVLEKLLASSASRNIDPAKLDVLTEYIAHLSDEDHEALLHPTEGIMSVQKFLPEKAEIREFLDKRKAKAEQFKPAHSTYRKLEPDDPNAPWNRETDTERKKRIVKELLGYNPGETTPKRDLTPPSASDLETLKGVSKLKQPSISDATPQLRKLIADQDMGHT